MIIISEEKLNKAGYKTNSKRSALFPIERKGDIYSVLVKGFLIVTNCENLQADERTKKNKVRDLIESLAKDNIIVYRQEDLHF